MTHLAKSAAQSKHSSKSLISAEARLLLFWMTSYPRMDFLYFCFSFFPLGTINHHTELGTITVAEGSAGFPGDDHINVKWVYRGSCLNRME